MSVRYHLVYFTPDLVTRTRFTVGAVVQLEGTWRWVEAPLLPSADYLGGGKQTLLEMGLEWLRGQPEAGLPQVAFPEPVDPRAPPLPRMNHLGNHFHTDVPLTLPGAAADPTGWLRQHSLPNPPTSDRRGTAASSS